MLDYGRCLEEDEDDWHSSDSRLLICCWLRFRRHEPFRISNISRHLDPSSNCESHSEKLNMPEGLGVQPRREGAVGGPPATVTPQCQ